MMFERFSSDARAAVIGAQEVARRRGAGSIEAVHLLLAVSEQEDGAAVRGLDAVGLTAPALDRLATATESADAFDGDALAALGIDLDAVRARTDAAFGTGALERAGRRRRRGHLTFTNEAAKVLERSLREALALRAPAIDSGHVLLALLHDEDTSACRTLVAALAERGSDPAALRAVLTGQGSSGDSGRAAS
jgi:ATP-dependent Clp protease ATP-binding subunit ClpA